MSMDIPCTTHNVTYVHKSNVYVGGKQNLPLHFEHMIKLEPRMWNQFYGKVLQNVVQV